MRILLLYMYLRILLLYLRILILETGYGGSRLLLILNHKQRS